MTDSVKEKILSLKGPIFVYGASGFIGANLFKDILATTTEGKYFLPLILHNLLCSFPGVYFQDLVDMIYKKYFLKEMVILTNGL